MSMITLSIIILSYNTRELTRKCIESIIARYEKELKSGEFELIVIDNASSDDTVGTINKSYVKLIKNKENYGFAKGSNIGARVAKGKYLFFLNSDTKILDRGLLQMIAYLNQHELVGVLGAKLYNVDGSEQKSAGSFYTLPLVFLMLFGADRAGFLRSSPKDIQKVDWVSGGAMMVRSDFFKSLDGFDEAFFMYVEDMELCFRAKKEGFATYFFPKVAIEHKTLGSSNRTFAILSIYKGLLYFYKKHGNFIQYSLVRLFLAIKASLALVVGIVSHNTYLTFTYRKAISLL